MPASQAGRRGFDPRLPLHFFNVLTANVQLREVLHPPMRVFQPSFNETPGRPNCTRLNRLNTSVRNCGWARGAAERIGEVGDVVTTDPQATGQSCPEGWTFYRMNDRT